MKRWTLHEGGFLYLYCDRVLFCPPNISYKNIMDVLLCNIGDDDSYVELPQNYGSWDTSGREITRYHYERREFLLKTRKHWVLNLTGSTGDGSPLYTLEQNGDVVLQDVLYPDAKEYLENNLAPTDTYTEVEGNCIGTISGASLQIQWLRTDLFDMGVPEESITLYLSETA